MSKVVNIDSELGFKDLLKTTDIVVVDFYADWCMPCKQIAPVFEQLAGKLSRPKRVVFAKVNVDQQTGLAQTFGITAMPTFLVFKNGAVTEKLRGLNGINLSEVIQKLVAHAGPDTSGDESISGVDLTPLAKKLSREAPHWLGASLPRGFKDITSQVDLKGIDLLNADGNLGNARELFGKPQPSGASQSGKGKAKEEVTPDWVESDTDEQLMLFLPFQASLKIHSLHITSLPPSEGDDIPMRPKTINLYSNRAHVLGFEEAEDIPATQSITLSPEDWDAQTGTAKLELRFVKFQNVSSLVIFIVDGDGDGERVRVDRIRIVGEAGEQRKLGKLEKIGDEAGE